MPKPNHVISREQELDIAKLLGARTIARSGAGAEKGDVRKRRVVRVEAKVTRNKSFSVTTKILDNLLAACGPEEEPVLYMRFMDNDRIVREVAVVRPSLVESFVGEVS